MIRREVEPQAGFRAEVLDRFELEAADFEREHIVAHAAGDDFAQGHAVIATGQRFHAAAVEQRRNQFGAGALAVGASDGSHRHVGQVEGKFGFPDEWNTCIREFLRQWPVFVQAGADDDEIKITGFDDEITCGLPKYAFEVLDLLRLVTFVKNRHIRAMHPRQTRSTKTAASSTENGKTL